MKSLERFVPRAPVYRGTWTPIYLQTIVGSEEKLTILIVVKGHDGNYSVFRAIRNDILKALFGSKSSNFKDMIEWIATSLESHLDEHATLTNWHSPLEGTVIGGLFEAADDDIKGIIKQGIRFSSSFSDISLKMEKPKIYGPTESYKWFQEIKQEILAADSDLKDCFKASIQVGHKGGFVNYDFANDNYAFKYNYLNPRHLSRSVQYAKANIIDLTLLKESQYMFKPKEVEIVVYSPEKEFDVMPQKLKKDIENSISVVQDAAETNNIPFYRANESHETANHILGKALAA